MTRVRTSVDIDAPPEKVWEVISDPRNLPRWDRHVTLVEGVPVEGLRKGAEYTTELRFMAVGARVAARVLEFDPPRFASVRLSGLLEATVSTRLTPIDGGRTRLEQEVDYRFRGGPLGRMAAQALRLTGGASYALRRGVLAQKRQVEGAS